MAMSIRALVVSGLLAVAAVFPALAQQRPPIGDFGSAPDAMIFYVAKGPAGACGVGCSEWIVAEGAVQFDTYKRLIAILDRHADRKLPVVINSRGASNLNVATTLGRILRDRGIDASAGPTYAKACRGIPEADCFTLKRLGGPLIGVVDVTAVQCDITCVLILAGGVHRTLPADAKVVLGGMFIRDRLSPNVSDAHREGLASRYGEQFRMYLRDMGVDPVLLDIVDKNSEQRRKTELQAADWQRLNIVTASPP
jgi:hypothetical protein